MNKLLCIPSFLYLDSHSYIFSIHIYVAERQINTLSKIHNKLEGEKYHKNLKKKRIKCCLAKRDCTLNKGGQGELSWKDFIRRNNVIEVRKPAVDIWGESMPGRGKSICIGLASGAFMTCLRKSQRANKE